MENFHMIFQGKAQPEDKEIMIETTEQTVLDIAWAPALQRSESIIDRLPAPAQVPLTKCFI